MSEKIVTLIFFVHVLVALFLFSIRTGNVLANRILASFLLVVAVDLSNFLFFDFYANNLNLEMLRAHAAAFVAPLLLFYVRAVLYKDLKLRARDAVHALPFIAATVIFLPRFYLQDDAQKWAFYDNANPLPEVLIVHVLFYLQLAGYLLVIFRELFKHRKVLKENFSDSALINQRWLTYFMCLFTFDFFIGLARNVFKFTNSDGIYAVLTPLMLAGTLAFACWILWQALYHPQLFQGIDSRIVPVEDVIEAKKQKNEKVISDDNHLHELMSKLTAFMEKEQPYLNSTLTIESLAQQLAISSEELSIVFNRHIGKHFYDFVNGYRIDLAASMLASQTHAQKTILAIMHDVGFNSKSSFNAEFKKQKHMTPSQYRKQQLTNNEN